MTPFLKAWWRETAKIYFNFVLSKSALRNLTTVGKRCFKFFFFLHGCLLGTSCMHASTQHLCFPVHSDFKTVHHMCLTSYLLCDILLHLTDVHMMSRATTHDIHQSPPCYQQRRYIIPSCFHEQLVSSTRSFWCCSEVFSHRVTMRSTGEDYQSRDMAKQLTHLLILSLPLIYSCSF